MWCSWCVRAAHGRRMEPSSWPGHFRNRYIIRRDWHFASISGTIGIPVSPIFLFGGIVSGAASSVSSDLQRDFAPEDCCWGEPFYMLRSDQIRRWHHVLFCGLLAMVVHGFAIAQTPATTSTSTPTQTQKSAPGSTASTTAAPKHSGAHATTTHKSTHTATHTSAHTTAQKSKTAHGKKSTKQVSKKRGQQAIDSTRARQIQTALIREHYMKGEPTGAWDASTQAAMQKYQADQGWQSKTTPDSRALIKLGLGPSSDHLLNPESAMTSAAPAATEPKAGTKPASSESKVPNL